jgi:hypothetical protein
VSSQTLFFNLDIKTGEHHVLRMRVTKIVSDLERESRPFGYGAACTIHKVLAKRSSRAQARTTVGREFPISALSMAERGPSPAIAHVSCALSKIPYGGFSPVRLQAEVSLRSTLPYPFQV